MSLNIFFIEFLVKAYFHENTKTVLFVEANLSAEFYSQWEIWMSSAYIYFYNSHINKPYWY